VSGAGSKLGIVTGLKFEADILKSAIARHSGSPVLIACEGPGAARARRATESLVAQGATHLLSFGIAAAIDPIFAAGDVIVATAFRKTGRAEIESDRGWADRLVRRLPGARFEVIADSESILATAAEKEDLRRSTLAALADMESYGMANAAAGRPCAALRVISDTARQGLPPAAIKGANADGAVSIARVLMSICGNPMQIPALIRLGASTGAARRRLRALADLGVARGSFVVDE
jgi:nucleoside phosphorylase